MILFEVLLFLLAEVLLQIVGEMLADGGWRLIARSIAHTTRRMSQADPLAAAFGCAVFGALFGGLSGVAIPHHIVRVPTIPGLSIVVAPLVTGMLMELYGRSRRRAGRESSWLTTFSGGGMFAFVFAIVRLLILH